MTRFGQQDPEAWRRAEAVDQDVVDRQGGPDLGFLVVQHADESNDGRRVLCGRRADRPVHHATNRPSRTAVKPGARRREGMISTQWS